ncbi:MAG TPA: serine hydrolase domain-containing protein [Tepidisphaeraceae bacterium]|jgi:CubicO group peptidase (beta-lactamase class C family)
MRRTLDVIRSGIDQGLHIGAQLYVSLAGHTVVDEAVGLARPQQSDQSALPMTPDTITLWLSSGKPLTAVAIAQLWERGLLELDDPIARHIPDFAAHGKDTITIRHVLTHTAPLRLADTGWPDTPWDQIIRRICNTRPEPRWISGRTAGYSAHITWYLLGDIVQRVGGMPLPDYLRHHVFDPCGMTRTFVSMTPAEQAANADRLMVMQVTETPPMHDRGTETPQALAAPRPSGSIRGPARELGRFYETMLAHGRGIVSPQTVEAMTARHRVNTLDKTFHAVIDWGLGFMINSSIYGNADAPYQYGPHASPRAFGHSGNQSSAGFADPERALAVAVVFNGMPGEAAHQSRIRATLAAVYEDLGLTSDAP